MSLSSVVGEGDRRRSLEAMRDALAIAMSQAEPREMAPLANQLRQVLRELDEMPAGERLSKRDELAQRRQDRRSKAAAEPPAASGGDKRR
jgi:hypothetical protein